MLQHSLQLPDNPNKKRKNIHLQQFLRGESMRFKNRMILYIVSITVKFSDPVLNFYLLSLVVQNNSYYFPRRLFNILMNPILLACRN